MSFIFLKNAQIELTTDCVHRANVDTQRCAWVSLKGPQVESPADSSSPLGCRPRQPPPPPTVSAEAPQPWTLHETAQAVWPVFNVLQSLREAGLRRCADRTNARMRLLKPHLLLSVRDQWKDPEQLKGSCSVFPSSVQMFHDIIYTDAAHAHLLHPWWLYMEKKWH